jgi:hypothetical protein
VIREGAAQTVPFLLKVARHDRWPHHAALLPIDRGNPGTLALPAGARPAQSADGLLANLGLLFVPAGVGVVLYLPVLAKDWAPLSLAILAGTLAAIGVTGLLAQALLRRLDP